MVTVKYEDLILAFEFIGAAAPTEHSAYISLDTGAIYWTSEVTDGLDDDVPDDLEVSDRYVAIPHKTDLELGRDLALRFVAEQLPDRYTQVYGFSSGKARTRGSRICSNRAVYSSSGMDLKLTLPNERCAGGVPKPVSSFRTRD